MAKSTSDKGVRTEGSGVDGKVPLVDEAAGDEGIDDGIGSNPPPASPKVPAKSRDARENVIHDPLEDLVEDPPDDTATPPGPAFKDGRRK